jgi:MFS family permease
LAASVAVAFADSSIVVLALPDLYGAFDTTLVGVSWVITSYNLVVAISAGVLALSSRRLDPRRVAQVGLVLFTAASVGCAASANLPMLIAFRCVQGLGAALLLPAAIALLGGLTGGREAGISLWTKVAVLGAALGPVLGGVLTQLFDWRAIFVVQAPLAGAALLATAAGTAALPAEKHGRRGHGALAADAALALVFAALVGVLFLAVLLLITVWGLEPIAGALVVSALPAATLAARAVGRAIRPLAVVCGGALLLAAGLLQLALLPRVSNVMVAIALGFCGLGIGLAVPVLTRVALHQDAGVVRSGAITVAARHAGLVLGLVLIAPLLTTSLTHAGERALLGGTKAILDADVPIRKKVPIALALRDALQHAQKGEVPDLGKPFDDAGARDHANVRRARDSLVTTLESTLARGFRSSFALAALFALLALVPALRLRRLE